MAWARHLLQRCNAAVRVRCRRNGPGAHLTRPLLRFHKQRPSAHAAASIMPP